MNHNPRADSDRALAYPEPPTTSTWHHTTKPRPRTRKLTPEQQRRNRERLQRALSAR
ncbi:MULTISPECIES: hypothetical protein [unclassified Streptomyces]|uniref:hypothetical protein n=1 Tax=unclassified Streptomyces TaxID=2593676 RepID=UPI001396A064|nr:MULTISPECIES: hypothetical protein [unclassified Streptomyces]